MEDERLLVGAHNFVVLTYRLLSEFIMNKKMIYLRKDCFFNFGALNYNFEAFPLYSG